MQAQKQVQIASAKKDLQGTSHPYDNIRKELATGFEGLMEHCNVRAAWRQCHSIMAGLSKVIPNAATRCTDHRPKKASLSLGRYPGMDPDNPKVLN